jgi:hypothetical protein
MAVPAADSLLEHPGIRSFDEHFQIVIEFNCLSGHLPEVIPDELGGLAQLGAPPDRRSGNHVNSRRVSSVMGGRAGTHLEVPHRKSVTGFKFLNPDSGTAWPLNKAILRRSAAWLRGDGRTGQRK